MDRMDPDNFDSLAAERRTEVRGLEIEHFPGGENPWARGHEFTLRFRVGPNTDYNLTANAAELRRWSMILAEAALRFGEAPPGADPDAITDEMVERGRSAYWGPTYGGSVDERIRAILAAALTEPPTCPACGGDVHIDLSGAVWSAGS